MRSYSTERDISVVDAEMLLEMEMEMDMKAALSKYLSGEETIRIDFGSGTKTFDDLPT